VPACCMHKAHSVRRCRVSLLRSILLLGTGSRRVKRWSCLNIETETVLRAGAAGVVKAVGCTKGEMVEEGRELVDIEDEKAGES
jgi:hypothetical protein